MGRFEKFKALSTKSVDAAADIELINQYAVKELTPDDVYCFSVILCDNDVDRDLDRFTDATLDKLAELFVGKTGISDHRWSANEQIARLYRVEVETTTKKNRLGEPLKQLRGSAYMLRNETNQPVIDAIEGGILKEVSVSCSINKSVCSICGKPLEFDWRTWTYQCETGHIKGETYDGKLCVADLEEPTDAYEFSFVAVPAQRGAGVTKGAEDGAGLVMQIAAAELTADQLQDIIKACQSRLCSEEDRKQRALIIAENEKFLNNSKED